MIFPTLSSGQSVMYPVARGRGHQTGVLKCLDDSEYRYRDRPYLAKFQLQYTGLNRTDMLALKNFHIAMKGSFDSSFTFTFDGVNYGNCVFDDDRFQETETWPLLYNVTLNVTQTL